MIRAELDGTLATLDAVYDRLQGELRLPAHFGRNLDALWDALTTDLAGPVELVWRDHARAAARLGPDFHRLERLFRDVERERPDFRFLLD